MNKFKRLRLRLLFHELERSSKQIIRLTNLVDSVDEEFWPDEVKEIRGDRAFHARRAHRIINKINKIQEKKA